MGARILNELTGEAVLSDDQGREYHVLFDLSAVMAVEATTGHSAIDVLRNTTVTDCVAMILAGSEGYARRNPGAKRVNGNLAMRVLASCGGLMRVAPTLVESLSCAEGLGLGPDATDDDADEGDGDEPTPLPSPGS
jgi:hypothetical protein